MSETKSEPPADSDPHLAIGNDDETKLAALIETFPERIAELERDTERVLARLGVA